MLRFRRTGDIGSTMILKLPFSLQTIQITIQPSVDTFFAKETIQLKILKAIWFPPTSLMTIWEQFAGTKVFWFQNLQQSLLKQQIRWNLLHQIVDYWNYESLRIIRGSTRPISGVNQLVNGSTSKMIPSYWFKKRSA